MGRCRLPISARHPRESSGHHETPACRRALVLGPDEGPRTKDQGLSIQPSIANERLCNQRIARSGLRRPEDVVEWLGAVQAQEYAAAKWALGLRMREGTKDTEIERACESGRILRTHVMRPTWHFVTPADIGWMLKLTAPRVHKAMAPYHRNLGLDPAFRVRATRIFERALEGGQTLTRSELGMHLEGAGLSAKRVALALLTIHAEIEGVLCSGPRRGKQLTYTLLAARARKPDQLSHDEALAELTRRYFRSHGPATTRDFMWWSGLTSAETKRGLDMIRAKSEAVDGLTYWTVGDQPSSRVPDGAVHLLPIYDEYLVAYRDRMAVPHPSSAVTTRSRGTVTFQHAIVIGGQVAGTWKVARHADGLVVDVCPLRGLKRSERHRLADTAERYGRFHDRPVSLSIA